MKRILILAALALPTAAIAQTQTGPTHHFEGTEITVPPPAPQVSVIITRKNLEAGYELELRESFLPSIVRSVEAGPF